MKKTFALLAFCTVVFSCTKSEMNQVPERSLITLSASIQNSRTKVQSTEFSFGSSLSFQWEDGDSVWVYNDQEKQVFRLIPGSISKDSTSARFEGAALAAGMDSYRVSYGIDPSDSTHLQATFTNIDNTVPNRMKNPFARGSGNQEGFTLSSMGSALSLSLYNYRDSTITVSKIIVSEEGGGPVTTAEFPTPITLGNLDTENYYLFGYMPIVVYSPEAVHRFVMKDDKDNTVCSGKLVPLQINGIPMNFDMRDGNIITVIYHLGMTEAGQLGTATWDETTYTIESQNQ